MARLINGVLTPTRRQLFESIARDFATYLGIPPERHSIEVSDGELERAFTATKLAVVRLAKQKVMEAAGAQREWAMRFMN